MSERFVRIGIEIPLSLYANLDKITNGSAASGRILDAVKKHQERPRKPNRKPKCPNFSNCGDCVHAEFVWEGVTFRGIRCLKGCK